MSLFAPEVPDLSGPPLPASFFERPPVQVARELLGALIVRVFPDSLEQPGGVAALRIVETEAYDCPHDPSCYVIEKLPGATEALRGPAGRYYFHRSYEHALLNVVCMPPGYEATILIRAAEPLLGAALLQARRGPVKRATDLTNGPAKLVQALDIAPALAGLSVEQPECYFLPGEPLNDEQISVTARVGLRLGAALPWRFVVTGNPWVSPGKPSA
jgi:DNA-3-methyladenine glycosylase